MKNILTNTFIIGSMFFTTSSVYAGFGNLFSPETKVVYGSASHNISESSTSETMNFIKDLHSEYDLLVAKYNKYNETYIGSYNKNSLRVSSVVTAYSKINFSKRGQGYRATYEHLRGKSSTFIDLGREYNGILDSLINKIKVKAHHVKAEGTTSFGRGGIHLMAKNLKNIKSFDLTCTTEIYSDNSGGDSCIIEVEKLNLTKDATVYVSGKNGSKTLLPSKNIKTWSSDYWNNKI